MMTNEHDFFPAIDPRERPAGRKILVQVPKLKEKTAGGIILAQQSKEDAENTLAYGKVVAKGPDAYRPSSTVGEFGSDWCAVGDIVRFPRFTGDKFKVDGVTFIYLDDVFITGIAEGIDHLI